MKKIKQATELKEEGTTLFKDGKYESAFQKYKEASEVDEFNKSFNSAVFMNMGTCLSKLGKQKEAIKEFSKSIDCNPTYAKAYMKRSDCYEKTEKYITVYTALSLLSKTYARLSQTTRPSTSRMISNSYPRRLSSSLRKTTTRF